MYEINNTQYFLGDNGTIFLRAHFGKFLEDPLKDQMGYD